MRKRLRFLLLSLAAGFMLSTSGQALELGDRVPKLTLPSAEGETVTLPDHGMPAPTLVWFPLAWRTPAHLCDKLINAAQENNATLVIIPIYDYSSTKRIHKPLASEISQQSAAGTPEAEASGSAALPPADSSAAQPEQPSEEPAAEQAPSPVSPEPSAPPVEPPPPDVNGEPQQSEPAQNGGDLPADQQQSDPGSREDLAPEEAQQLFRERVASLAQQYPGAVFICDTDNQALLAYTDSFMTNILPNPDLFIIDAHGYVSWKAFYPGLTSGTLTRAIITARPKQAGR